MFIYGWSMSVWYALASWENVHKGHHGIYTVFLLLRYSGVALVTGLKLKAKVITNITNCPWYFIVFYPIFKYIIYESIPKK